VNNAEARSTYVQVDTQFNTKYVSKNPIIVFLNNYFLSAVASYVISTESKRILDVGCGEGVFPHYVTHHYSVQARQITGLDIEPERLRLASSINPEVQFNRGSIYHLPYQANAYDLVMAIEVLEHLEYPEKAINELSRVSKKWMILSVPNDRIFRLGNLLRLKYVSAWGNPPDHIQHWSKQGFEKLIPQDLRVIKASQPLCLWSIFLCQH
jgi:ubiquinone/menaquinone biosynthesis C-methylase UbiE